MTRNMKLHLCTIGVILTVVLVILGMIYFPDVGFYLVVGSLGTSTVIFGYMAIYAMCNQWLR